MITWIYSNDTNNDRKYFTIPTYIICFGQYSPRDILTTLPHTNPQLTLSNLSDIKIYPSSLSLSQGFFCNELNNLS